MVFKCHICSDGRCRLAWAGVELQEALDELEIASATGAGFGNGWAWHRETITSYMKTLQGVPNGSL